MWEIIEWDFRYYGLPLASVPSFNYLGQIRTALENYWPAVVGNLQKAQTKWDWMARILGWEGKKMQLLGVFFKIVVQAVLISGSETWVMTPHMGRSLGGFQHRLDQWIT